jgi:hypothetical protein
MKRSNELSNKESELYLRKRGTKKDRYDESGNSIIAKQPSIIKSS